ETAEKPNTAPHPPRGAPQRQLEDVRPRQHHHPPQEERDGGYECARRDHDIEISLVTCDEMPDRAIPAETHDCRPQLTGCNDQREVSLALSSTRPRDHHTIDEDSEPDHHLSQ